MPKVNPHSSQNHNHKAQLLEPYFNTPITLVLLYLKYYKEAEAVSWYYKLHPKQTYVKDLLELYKNHSFNHDLHKAILNKGKHLSAYAEKFKAEAEKFKVDAKKFKVDAKKFKAEKFKAEAEKIEADAEKFKKLLNDQEKLDIFFNNEKTVDYLNKILCKESSFFSTIANWYENKEIRINYLPIFEDVAETFEQGEGWLNNLKPIKLKDLKHPLTQHWVEPEKPQNNPYI
ncbi:MAG: hypothetical protein JWM09_850 [Francisellaceae bacterium]|nr:hypothetical protein [Francisellaceae bacterium]